MANEIVELIDKNALIKHLNTTMYRDVIEEIKNFPSVTPVIARQTNGIITLVPCKKKEPIDEKEEKQQYLKKLYYPNHLSK